MIKICLKGETDYSRLRDDYLNGIVNFVAFDKADILDEATKSSEKGKTRCTASELRKKYPELYTFLFKKDDNINRENLRMLLAGPKNMPASFGGKGDCFRTMHDFFEWIKSQCTPKNREEAKEVCKDIFHYKNSFGKSNKTYELLNKLNVRVCPYCNRIYTITLPSKKKLKSKDDFKPTRPTFDHFYSQDKYPYLALNLFNLVPSCHTCNKNKHTATDEIIYPYDEAFGKEAVFRVIPHIDNLTSEDSNPFAFLMGESDSFYIKFMGNDGISLLEDSPLPYRLSDIKDKEYRERIENSIQLLHLEEQYNEHKEEIRDILKSRYYFNEQYMRSVICPMLQKKMIENGLGKISQEQIMDIAMDMIFFSRINQEKWGDRPLSKLTSDILDQVSV